MNHSHQYVDGMVRLWTMSKTGNEEQVAVWTYLLEHGKEQDRTDIEMSRKIMERHNFKKGDCHYNSMIMALIDGQHYRMWQGIAMLPHLIPMVHSWLTDEHGDVVDPTWALDAGNPSDYFGLEVPEQLIISFGIYYKRSAWLVPAVALGKEAMKYC